MPKPKTLTDFEKRFPKVWKAYLNLREACDAEGPLDKKTCELVKIAVETARVRHGGLVAHILRARKAGASEGEIFQAILLATPLIGLPDVLDGFRTAQEVLKGV